MGESHHCVCLLVSAEQMVHSNSYFISLLMSHLLVVLSSVLTCHDAKGGCGALLKKKMKKCTQRSRDKSSMMKTFRIPTRLSCSYFHNRATLSLLHIYPPTAKKKKKTEREKRISTHRCIYQLIWTFTRTQSYRESLGFFDRMLTVRLCLCSCHANTLKRVNIRRERAKAQVCILAEMKNRRKLRLVELLEELLCPGSFRELLVQLKALWI